MATGVQYIVRDFINKTLGQLVIELAWEGEAIAEIGRVDTTTGDKAFRLKVVDVIVKSDPRYFRPAEVETLLGNPAKAKEKLGWTPKITLDEMVTEMAAYDLDQARQHALLKSKGFSVSVGRE
jgi:GDPmannose 4,6-dehydratase